MNLKSSCYKSTNCEDIVVDLLILVVILADAMHVFMTWLPSAALSATIAPPELAARLVACDKNEETCAAATSHNREPTLLLLVPHEEGRSPTGVFKFKLASSRLKLKTQLIHSKFWSILILFNLYDVGIRQSDQ